MNLRRTIARATWAARLVAACTLAAPLPAFAQLVFDGNLMYSNNGNNADSLSNQFKGSAASTLCSGVTPKTLGTVTYTHNRYADPLLPDAPYKANVRPNFQPAAGSPAFRAGGAIVMQVPNDGWFTQTCYSGAVGPDPGDDWTQGWTSFDSTGATRQDLHLTGMPNPRPLAIYDNVSLYTAQFWSPDSNYLVRGQLRIKSLADLTIPAGVVVFEERASLGTILVERGGHITAVGTASAPIIIITDDTPGTMTRGGCGGLVINGYARTNAANTCAGDSVASEGGAIGYWGGNDDTWNACTLRYVQVGFSGKEITPNNELNSFTFNGCGSGSTGDYLQALNGADDSFEWFGGTMSQKYLIGIDGTDDGYDWQMGTRNRAQFVILRQSPLFAPSGTQNGDKGIESDNNESDFNTALCSGYSNTTLANFTIIGDHRVGASFPGPTVAWNARRGTAGTLLNSIVYNMKTGSWKIDDNATMDHHCAAPPALPAVYCSPSITGISDPIAAGNLLVVNGAPNPFRNTLKVSFTVPRAGHVTVSVYAPDGRQVGVIADEEMSAGAHSVTWSAGAELPSGVYYYTVRAGLAQTTKKVTRIY